MSVEAVGGSGGADWDPGDQGDDGGGVEDSAGSGQVDDSTGVRDEGGNDGQTNGTDGACGGGTGFTTNDVYEGPRSSDRAEDHGDMPEETADLKDSAEGAGQA